MDDGTVYLLTFVGYLLTIGAIIIAFFIAFRQNYQIHTLQTNVNETKDTATRIETDSTMRSNAKKFFNRRNEGDMYYLYFPVKNVCKPLQLINQGDFYGIHIISYFLGEENLNFCPIQENYLKGSTHLQNNSIFLCAPNANPVLNDFLELKNPNKQMTYDLPCWFEQCPNDPDCRRIFIKGRNKPLDSPAESEYREAKKNLNYKHPDIPIIDYGIFGRLTYKGYKFFIIAGIHQYGTWTVATFLREIIFEQYHNYSSIFLGTDDFIAVITGQFENTKYKVHSITVLDNYIWTRRKEGDNWVLVKK